MCSKSTNKAKLKAVDFFCGAGGMSYGLHVSGIKILGGVDVDEDCEKTYKFNLPKSVYLKEDITKLNVSKLAKEFELVSGDNDLIFCGCSPCQFWSKISTNKTKSEKTAFLLEHFERFIGHFRPGYVVVENVPGLLTKKHQSILPGFLDFLKKNGYIWGDGIVDASHYGVPQHRKRYLLIASRCVDKVQLPKASTGKTPTVKQYIANLPVIDAGEVYSKDKLHRASVLSRENLKRIRRTPINGGDRSAWKEDLHLQIKAYEGKDNIFKDVYGRMHWEKPAPTITTRFNSLSNGRFGHPCQDRAISLREGALLQTFPKEFKFFSGNQSSIARQIGNAVPPALAERIGLHLIRIANKDG